jgi:tRNA(fMet)-specific endonuclease VapC
MKYLLDTDICIYIIKKKPEQVLRKLTKLASTEIAISTVTLSELIYGAEKSQHRQKNIEALSGFLVPIDVLPWDESAAQSTGEVRAQLEKSGKVNGPYDLQIAGQAISLNLILVTNNEKEFSRVKGLRIENWVNKTRPSSIAPRPVTPRAGCDPTTPPKL